MIIPPDPDKDPALLSPSSSTPSLLPPPTESSSSIRQPEVAHRNPAFGYPFGDDLGLGFTGEALPPYEGRRVRQARMEGQVNRDRQRQQGIIIPPRPRSASTSTITPSPIATSSTSHLPITHPSHEAGPSTTSASKLWESSDSTRTKRRRCLPALPIPPRLRKWWKRWRRYVQAALVLLMIGIGVMIGMLVGFRRKPDGSPPPQDADGMSSDGRRTTSWNITGESLNITYVQSRDGPAPSDGNMTQCNLFFPLNASNPFSLLSTPFPASSLYLTSFAFPLTSTNTNTNASLFPGNLTNTNQSLLSLPGDLAITATGLGASGTLEIVGSDSSDMVANGTEGTVVVDVVVRYSGPQELNDMMKVCRMVKGGPDAGVGIYTPQATDGKVTNAYMINPMLLPSFHVVIRFPPSVMSTNMTRPSISLPSLTFNLDRMGVRFGDMKDMVDFGAIRVNSGRGGLVAEYVAAETVDIITAQNSVRGRWNISQSISVNNTAGSIISEVILFDPNANATASSPVLPPSRLTERDTNSSNMASVPSGMISAAELIPTHSVNTRFFTTQGLVSVSYLHQPPRTALTSIIANGGGDLDISLHPNYVGPFILKDLWGDIRLPQLQAITKSDPQGWGRTRTMVFGDVETPEGSMFSGAGLNESVIANSGSLITGAAYWAGPGPGVRNGTVLSAKDVQNADEGKGSEVAIMGSWGDIRVCFDGT